jgi:hypothetical protein
MSSTPCRPLASLLAAQLLAFGVLGLAGCELVKPKVASVKPAPNSAVAPPAEGGASGSDPGPGSPPAAPPPISLSDAGAPSPDAVAASADAGTGTIVQVYAHSGSDLFRVHPQSLEITRVGPFVVKTPVRDRFLNTVTDIALDKDGRMTGITFTELLSINVDTAECQVIAPLRQGGSMNGLSWIRNDNGEETLEATGNDGSVLRIDPKTGTVAVIGNLGKGQRSSGDLVSVSNHGTLITLRGDGPSAALGNGTDLLAKLDPISGAATVIGPTGFKRVYGIGFWGNRVFGFTDTGQFILIDPKTGAGTQVQQTTAFPFWGAGVSTSTPVVVIE